MTIISVIIPHFNDPEGLKRCLAALERQTVPRKRFEVVVADNNSAMPLAQIEALASERARVVRETIPGAGPARNAAVAASRGQILAFTDADCVPAPGWLEAGLAALERYALVGGRVSVFVADPVHKTGVEAFEAVFAFDNKRYVEQLSFSVTANLFCARSTFDTVGPFKSGMSEDYEWCLRAGQAGFAIGYAPAAKVGHPARANWQELVVKWRRIQRETFMLRPPTLTHKAKWLARAWLMPLSIAAHTPKILRSPELSSASERLRAFGCLIKLRLWRMADAHRIAFKKDR